MFDDLNKLGSAPQGVGGIFPALRRITVSEQFWQGVHSWFPALRKSPDYEALFWYLLFGSWSDRDSKRLLLCSDILSACEGRSETNTKAEAFLERFKRDVLGPDTQFVWSAWNPREGKCRQLLKLHWGDFQSLVDAELRGDFSAGRRVYLDGRIFRPGNLASIRQEERKAAELFAPGCAEAKEIQTYLHDLPPHLFNAAIRQNFPAALKAARNLPAHLQEQQMRLLRLIQSQPKPFYFASEKSVRLFARDSVANLQSSVRKALTSGWIDADLRSAQLAICGWMWGVKPVLELLASGENVWSYFLGRFGVPKDLYGTVKPVLKRAVYAVCFGMQERNLPGFIKRYLKRAGYEHDLSGAFLYDPIIEALLAARADAFAAIEQAAGAVTCFEKQISTAERKAKSIAAELAQAWEMFFIVPAFRVARQTRDFTITLYQFDGFSVHFMRREQQCRERISEAVNSALKARGILSSLEWEN